jgi:hypothetical protein
MTAGEVRRARMLAPAQPRALNSPSSIAFLVPPAHVWSGDPFGDDPIARPSSEIALARDERNVAFAIVRRAPA